MKYLIIVVAACFLLNLLADFALSSEEVHSPPLLTVICVNGFRWDYLAKYSVPTPMLDFLSKKGVRAKYVQPIYPAKPVPNAMSMVTGLYAEYHGFVGDSMYDPQLHEKWTTWAWPNGVVDDGNAEKSTRWFDNVAEPIWHTNAQRSLRRKSGLMMWPLGRIDFPAGRYKDPNYLRYNATMPYLDRIDELIRWFTDSKSPINFGLVYFELLDDLGKTYGPNHAKIREGLFFLDSLVGYFLQELNKVNLLENMNIMIVSGHGMSEVKDSVPLAEFVDPKKFELIDRDQLWPKPEYAEELEEQLRKIARVRVIRKDDLPEFLHIRESRRTPPMTLQWDDGWLGRVYSFDPVTIRGDHGFDPSHRNMRSAFIAYGPAFRKGLITSGTELTTVDLYPLMCRVLRLKPEPHNGTYSHVHTMIHTEYAQPENNSNKNRYSVFALLMSFIYISLRY